MSAERYNPKESEPRWRDYWEEQKIYHFNASSQQPVFSIDTPPPYVSAASLHVGHAMSYSQAEFVIRFRRMQGYNVFYPMGFDDNGLPTERFVEKKYKIENKSKIGRKEFIDLCLKETRDGAKTYKDLWRSLGVSVDWSLEYSTINARCQKVAQESFLDLLEKGLVVRKKDPMLWCPKLQTALAQADVIMEERQGAFYTIEFSAPQGQSSDVPLMISTTRPELLPACVALYVNPEDGRYKSLIGKKAVVPLAGHDVPILTDAAVEKDFGTGLMMVCTWGDAEDVRKWREHQLESRPIIGYNGRLTEKAGKYAGLSIEKAREAIVADLKAGGHLKKTESITHNVGINERSGAPVEFYETEQWFIRVLDFKEELLGRGEELRWFPSFMHVRYVDWVKNLKWDWCISRSRFYGVPFPVWYCAQCKEAIVPPRQNLPVDPLSESAPVSQCPKCGAKEFKPESDVMDTWMTSSLTPLINAQWPDNKDLMSKIYPMSIRVQAFEIIRTWLFYTIVKSHFHTHKLPWKSVMISGWGLDDKGRKMSKSEGNFVAPETVIEKYSADALRFWAAGSTLGRDLRYNEEDVKDGNRLVTKLWNAFRFIFLPPAHNPGDESAVLKTLTPVTQNDLSQMSELDKWMLSELHRTVKEATAAFEECEYSHARNCASRFFWEIFCDNYLEFIKGAMWKAEGYSDEDARRTRNIAAYAGWTIIRLFAPFVPYITEELFQRYFRKTLARPENNEELVSVHVSPWPIVESMWHNTAAEETGRDVVGIVSRVRRFKTENKLSPAAPLSCVTVISDQESAMVMVKKAERELRHTLRAQSVVFQNSENNAKGVLLPDSSQDRFKVWVSQ